jgi:hypothetical protein
MGKFENMEVLRMALFRIASAPLPERSGFTAQEYKWQYPAHSRSFRYGPGRPNVTEVQHVCLDVRAIVQVPDNAPRKRRSVQEALENCSAALALDSRISSVASQAIAGNPGANTDLIASILPDLVAYRLEELAAISPGRRNADHRIEDRSLPNRIARCV